MAGDELINTLADPVHAGGLQQQPERQSQRQFFQQAANAGITGVQTAVAVQDVDCAHQSIIRERGMG